MIRFRLGSLWLISLGVAACATAEGGPNIDGFANGGSAGASAGSSGARVSAGSAGAHASGGSPAQGGASSAVAGSSGSVALAGSSGASGGSGGVGGSGGSSVTAPVFVTGACAASPTMSLSYKQGSSSPKQITAQYQFINTSDVPIPLASLIVRYFFSNEETSGWNTAIYDAKLDGGTGGYRPISGATLSVIPLGMTLPGADTYAELAFTSPLTIEKGATATISWDMQPHSYNAPDQVQSDDYSYDAAATGFTVSDHVVIYQGSAAVWGCAPGDAAANGGAGGTAGSSGSAGLSGTSGVGGASAGAAGLSSGAGGMTAGAGGTGGASAGGVSGDGGASAAGASAGSGAVPAGVAGTSGGSPP